VNDFPNKKRKLTRSGESLRISSNFRDDRWNGRSNNGDSNHSDPYPESRFDNRWIDRPYKDMRRYPNPDLPSPGSTFKDRNYQAGSNSGISSYYDYIPKEPIYTKDSFKKFGPSYRYNNNR